MLKNMAFGVALMAGSAQAAEVPKNVIFFIGDGMGPAYTTAYRYYQADSQVSQVTDTVFDRLLIGSASTFPHDETVVTDSAAGATALATGTKSYNGAIGVDAHKQPLDSMLVQAKSMGWHTGVIATSHVNHATPASFVAHADSRRNYQEIAEQFYSRRLKEDQPLVDLILGGGQRYFPMEQDQLGSKMVNWGYQYADKLTQLDSLTRLPALGLFAPKQLPYAVDSDQPKRLSAMVSTGLRLLSQSDTPFFLMVEGSLIDWCGHDNDIACAMKEMADFAGALEVAEAFAQERGDTLVVFTADHSTGGLTLGAGGEYRWEAEQVKQTGASLRTITDALLNQPQEQFPQILARFLGFELTQGELGELAKVSKEEEALRWKLASILSGHSYTGWTTSGHTAVDVPLGAMGPGSERFRGHLDNTEIAKALKQMIR
ncbi:alkaline phosphatase [Ferrimonas sp. YFM]|uniref:alkaline phosphatase n=1 Tax=Ferrimonas sp. YFM TaxID=3028878 RepID=UPI0025727A75|nr:alkaline phosphatase [Ferrimonas sp. YFM]BDY05107.1 alkaline phosphatase [Ferrimonas sp. YFM]